MWEKELEIALFAVKEAQKEIIKIYHQGFDVEIKEDNSPVTNADKIADKIISEILHKAFPKYALLTEESEDNHARLNNDYVWIVDPVDGTKDFVAKDDEFTTNIALAYKHQVVVGVVGVCAKNEYYYASKGNGAYFLSGDKKEKIHVNEKLNDLICYSSVFHFSEAEISMIEKHKDKISKIEKKGSSLKACYIAHGKGEISYRLSQGTKEWDTAASDIIVKEAGGIFVEPDGKDIVYNREDVYNRRGYIIANRKENILL